MEIFSNISASSKKLYTHNLKKLNQDQEIKNLNFLKNKENILEMLESKKPNTKRTYLISIISAVKNSENKAIKKLYDYYYPMLEQLNKELINNTKKTDKEVDNWITDEDLKEITDNCDAIIDEIKGKRKIDDKQYSKLLDCLILSLYTKIAPRRSLDYIEMVVDKPAENQTTNYYHQSKFYFNRFKTQKKYQQQIIDVPPSLDNIIKLYLKYKKGDTSHFLVNVKGVQLKTSTDMTNRLNKIFDAKVSSSMLRKQYLTSKYGNVIEDLQEDTKNMATSVGTAMTNYIKKN
tara:strand:+ start:30 stop:899 length:870 start_codon:yes stop_codon:yes gene_type:complete